MGSDALVETPTKKVDLLVVPAVPVGTVDKSQGRQAAMVFYTMTTSSGGYITRSVDFLVSRNRLNVAVCRARCLAYLVLPKSC